MLRKVEPVMKNNLISIIILALLIVNIVLTAIMMSSVTSTNQKPASLVGDIASAISLDIQGAGSGEASVSLENTTTYTISNMQIALKKSVDENGVPDEKDHYAQLSVVLSMNNAHEDYKTYGETISDREDLIKGKITEVVGGYTIEEAKANPQAISNDILKSIQALYSSDFIFDVTLISPIYM